MDFLAVQKFCRFGEYTLGVGPNVAIVRLLILSGKRRAPVKGICDDQGFGREKNSRNRPEKERGIL